MYKFDVKLDDAVLHTFECADEVETILRYEHMVRLLDDSDCPVELYATYPERVAMGA